MNKIIGWLGASILSICAVSQVPKTSSTKNILHNAFCVIQFAKHK